jgi:hypothetical protein
LSRRAISAFWHRPSIFPIGDGSDLIQQLAIGVTVEHTRRRADLPFSDPDRNLPTDRPPWPSITHAPKFVSPLEGNGFEISVPRKIGSDFESSVGLRPIDRRRGGMIRAVVGLGKPIELFSAVLGAATHRR